MSDYFASLIRTYVPLAVGVLLTYLSLHGINSNLTGNQLTAFTTAITAIIVALYYAVARILEQFVSSKFGWLLGLAKKPQYKKLIQDVEKVAQTAFPPSATLPHGE